MKKKKDGIFSLKWGLSLAVALCWLLPIAIVVSVSGYLLSNNYERQIRHNVEAGTRRAMEQVELRVDSAIEASKAASYEGEIQDAYRRYLENGNQAMLYRDVTDYFSRAYSRDRNFKGVFLTFLDEPEEDYYYVISKGSSSREILRHYREQAREALLEVAGSMDTGITFRMIGGELYMVRNLLNADFQSYGVLTMLCDRQELFQSLETVNNLTAARLTLDGVVIPVTGLEDLQGEKQAAAEYFSQVEGHALTFQAQTVQPNLWGAMPDLRWAVAVVTLLAVPLVLLAVTLFYRHVTKPVSVLVEASNRVEAGERGYQITEEPRTQEFRRLTRHFNSMSTELKNQFERLYLEQQSLQEARIKALQSQINPHFLGNTLEIINWEARLAENDKVSAMIEALSTMLDAAIGRDGRSMISLREELTYVDAYLYIIQQRMGDRLTVRKEIDETMLDQLIPRLILQPLVENAVEHDISRSRGSELIIRVYHEDRTLFIQVEHEGTITGEDRKNIDRLLNPDNFNQKGQVGIRNLNQRLRLICGGKGRLSIEQIAEGRILASICLPFLSENGSRQEIHK